MKKRVFAILIISVLMICGCGVYDRDAAAYNEAVEALKESRTEQAYNAFLSVKDYRDSGEYLEKFSYVITGVKTTDYGFGDVPAIENEVYEYDGDGNLLRHEGSYEENAGPDFSQKNSYENSLLTRTETESEAGYSTITYKYGDNGRLISKTGFTQGPDVGGVTEYTYDGDGNCISVKNTSHMGTDPSEYGESTAYHTDVTDYSYDDKGRCISSVCDYGDSKWTYTATYDGDGNVVKIDCVNSDGTETSTVFSYKDGNCVRIETDYGVEEFEYDENGRIASSRFMQEGELASESTYTTALIYRKNGQPVFEEFIKHYYTGINAFE